MGRFDETVNEVWSDVAATLIYRDELDRLIARHGFGAVRHYLEHRESHCVTVSLSEGTCA